MADIADQADEQNERAREAGIKNNRKRSGPPACGYCYNCGETLTGGLRWCDGFCRDDWEARQK